MGYGIVTTEGPAEEPLTLAEAKAHLNVAHEDDDALIRTLIQAAREQTEVETGRRWVTQTITLTLESFPTGCDLFLRDGARFRTTGGVIDLPVEPVQEVEELRYYDASGTLQTLATSEYLTWLAHSPPVVYPAPGKLWPPTQAGRLAAVEVELVAGYADATAVPAAAKQAMLLAVAQWYENRGDAEDVTKCGLPAAALRLCRSLSTGAYS